MDVVASTQAVGLYKSVLVSAVEPVAQTKAVDNLAASRFAELMQSPPASEGTPARSVSGVVEIGSTSPPASLGDRLLQGMERLSGDLKAGWDNVNHVLASPRTLTAHDMLGVQMQLTRIAIEYELVGKVTSRTTQTIDQLERLQ